MRVVYSLVVLFILGSLRHVSGGRMTTADKIAVLNLHNSERCNAPNSPTFMPAMYWDSDLEAVAQKWIDTCPGNDIDQSHQPYPMGSNWAGGSGNSYTPLALAQLWANEKNSWAYTSSGTTDSCSSDCGHYTQMVWANSIRVGCATNTNPCSSGMTTQLDCVYSPAGNFNNQPPYPISSTGSSLKNACSFTSQTSDFLTPSCSTPCANGGTCTSFNFCKCASGYTGPFCEVASTSLPSDLSQIYSCNINSDCNAFGGGSCCNSFLNWGFGLTCAYSKPSGWTSSGSCSAPVCSSACQNGGTCIDTNLCACPVGFTGAQCQSGASSATTTLAPGTTTTAASRTTTTRPTNPGTTQSTQSTTPTTTTPTTTNHPVSGAIGLQPFFDSKCTNPYGAEIYVQPSPNCITLGAGKAQVSVEVTCDEAGSSSSSWSLQVWSGAECDGSHYSTLSGASSNMENAASCPAVPIMGRAFVAFKVDCGIASVLSSQITSGSAYPNAGAQSAAAMNVQPLLALWVAAIVTIVSFVYSF